ncbi:MAG: DUF4340 domain-containing protein [Oscillospiraceae bacterium]|nr:DUF4340 domain-containing protein [Oscillospiraceae bacterium]
MKQYKWIWILAAAAVIFCCIFFIVDAMLTDKEERAAIGGPKTLFSFDSTLTRRIEIDNEDGHFRFDWNTEALRWELTSEEQFTINAQVVATICNYFCSLQSEKTVVFDAEDTTQFGFDHPVTVKVYTTETGEDDPYVLYVGDNTPTFDAYYVMVEGSDDIYTINYSMGSIFCVAKDTLKSVYLFDAFSTQVNYYRLERGGKTIVELTRNEQNEWGMKQPVDFPVYRSEIENMINNLVRITVTDFVEENPSDLEQYGLEEPYAKLLIKGVTSDGTDAEEIWFGNPCSEETNETKMYGYFTKSKQVFKVLRNHMVFLDADAEAYIEPYCVDINIEDISAVHVDLGDIYDMNCTLHIDYANGQYAFNDIDIDAFESTELSEQFQTYYRELSTLRFTELALDAKPEGEPAATITYDLLSGGKRVLSFIPESSNNYYVMLDGAYTGKTIRLNRFTGTGGISKFYDALVRALDAIK